MLGMFKHFHFHIHERGRLRHAATAHGVGSGCSPSDKLWAGRLFAL